MKKNKNSYTSAVTELEEIIDKIENGDLSIDELSDMVKKAAELVRQCQVKLRTTEDDLNKTLDDLN
jgi:exodeoxyribonuclease VII small subunit